MNLFYFELKKFLKNPKNKICLALLVIILGGLFMFNQTMFNQKSSELNLATTTMNAQQAKQWVGTLKSEVASTPDDEALKQELVLAEKQEKIYADALIALKNNDFEKFADLENQANLDQLKLIERKDSNEYQVLSTQIKYYQAVKKVNGKMSAAANDTSEAAFVTGRSIMAWLSSTAIFVLLTVLIADTVSSEIESSQVRFYQLIGGRKFKHLLLKMLIPIMVAIVTVIVIYSLQYVITGVRDTFGTWRYPYLLANGKLMPIGEISVKSLVLFVVALVFIASLGQLLSLIFKKSLVVIGLIVVCLTGFMTFEQEAWFQPIKKFLPFEYLGYGHLLNDVKILPDNFFMIGIVYLLSLSIIFTLMSGYLYQNYYYRKVGK